jgi:hypothetical protein
MRRYSCRRLSELGLDVEAGFCDRIDRYASELAAEFSASRS